MASLVQRFERNTTGRDLIVGDIHGFFTKVQAELDAIGFDPAKGDRLFSVGDLVDRGPESALALDWLAQPWFHAVQGNHEDMAIRWPDGQMDPGNYRANGGGWNIGNDQAARERFATAFAALPVAITLETAQGDVGIVHADCPLPSWTDFIALLDEPRLTARQRDTLITAAQWSRDRVSGMADENVSGVRAVVVGHTPMDSFTSLGNVLFIDTGGWLQRRHFTILDAATLRPASAGRIEWDGV